MKKLPLFIIGLVILASCKDEEKNFGPTVVSGQVFSFGTALTVPAAQVRLYEVDENLNHNILQLTKTDSNGGYSFSFDANKEYDYKIMSIAMNHYMEDNNILWPKVSKFGQSNTVNLSLYGHSYAHFKLKNTSGASSIRMGTFTSLDGKYMTAIFNNSIDTFFYARMPSTSTWTIPYYVHYGSEYDFIVKETSAYFAFDDTTTVQIDY